MDACRSRASGAKPSQARRREEQSTNAGVTSEIIALDFAAKTLTGKGASKDGGVYVTNRYTMNMNGDKAIGLGDLEKGSHVAVTSDKEDGKNIAQYITMVDTGNQRLSAAEIFGSPSCLGYDLCVPLDKTSAAGAALEFVRVRSTDRQIAAETHGEDRRRIRSGVGPAVDRWEKATSLAKTRTS
jgi:hypothetical protein